MILSVPQLLVKDYEIKGWTEESMLVKREEPRDEPHSCSFLVVTGGSSDASFNWQWCIVCFIGNRHSCLWQAWINVSLKKRCPSTEFNCRWELTYQTSIHQPEVLYLQWIRLICWSIKGIIDQHVFHSFCGRLIIGREKWNTTTRDRISLSIGRVSQRTTDAWADGSGSWPTICYRWHRSICWSTNG